MNTRLARNGKIPRNFPRLSMFQLFLLTLMNLVALPAGQGSLLEASIDSNGLRPEDILLEVFAKSFDPVNGSVSPECQRDSAIYRAALLEYKPWALQMYDSSTKMSPGLITGNYQQLGNYDECLRVRSNNGFIGKACSAKVRFVVTGGDDDEIHEDQPDMRDLLLNVAVAWGFKNWTSGETVQYEWLWCVPSSCTGWDVAEALTFGLKPLKRSPKVDFSVTVGNDSCHTEHSDRAVFAVTDWIYLCILLLFGILIVASTAYDLAEQRNPAKPDLKDTKHKILTCFSVYTNGKSLISVERGTDAISCLDGIRFLSICWVVYGHTVHLQIGRPLLDISGARTMHLRWDTLMFLNNNIATDVFFLLSGTLLAYSEMGRKAKNPEGYKFNFWNLYIHRYLRVTPSYAMVIGFYATVFYKMGSGPRWDHYVGENSDHCVKNWWTNLLYVNNYIDLPSSCMSQSWYLAADMQMVWLSPIILYPMLGNGRRNEIIFLALLAAAFVASILTPFLITYYQRLTGTLLFYKDNMDLTNVFLQIYTRMYTRGGPYLVGLGLGYFLRWIKQRTTTIPTSLVISGWIVTTVAVLAVIFGPRRFFLVDYEYNAVEAAFYAGFHRHVFALAIAWIVVASVFGRAGPVGALLSWSAWVPFSKLTYAVYLSHYIILLYDNGTSRSSGYYSIFGCVQMFFGNLMLALFISSILYLCFEVPFCRLDQLLISGALCNRAGEFSKNKEKFNPTINLEYRRSSTVSTAYMDFKDRSEKIGARTNHLPVQCSKDANNSSATSTSFSIDLNGIRDEKTHHVHANFKLASGSNDAGTIAGVDNPGFEKTS